MNEQTARPDGTTLFALARLLRDPRRDWLWISTMVILGLALRVYRLGEQSLWLDEGFTWYRAALPFTLGLQALRQVFTHPPLYHLLSYAWVQLGSSEWMLRLPQALVGAATIPLLYRLGRRLEGRMVGLLSALLLAVNPFHVWYSRDARDYTLVVLLSLLVLSGFLRLLRGERVWVLFTIFSGLLYFTHYFGLLLALAQFLHLASHLRRYRLLFRRWVVAQAIAFFPLFVWLIVLFTQQTRAIGIGWIPRPALWAPLITLWNLAAVYSGAPGILTVATLCLFALALGLGVQAAGRWRSPLVLWLLVPPLTMVLVSWGTGRNLYVDRYFAGGLPALLLLAGLGVRQANRKGRAAGIALAALLFALSVANTARIYDDPAFRKTDWRGGIGYVQDHALDGDVVVLPSLESYAILAYYDGDLEWDYLNSYLAESDLAAVTAGRKRAWLLVSNPQASNHLLTNAGPFDVRVDTSPVMVRWLADHRSAIVDERAFAGLTVLLVQLAP